MAAHSSTLAWRIPGTEAPGGLQSWGRRVRHDQDDLRNTAAMDRLPRRAGPGPPTANLRLLELTGLLRPLQGQAQVHPQKPSLHHTPHPQAPACLTHRCSSHTFQVLSFKCHALLYLWVALPGAVPGVYRLDTFLNPFLVIQAPHAQGRGLLCSALYQTH